ncbi:hypothetical protein [Paenibacillus amylolyticus]|uniref:hypothetical protein n=1 Tax=Paenibacillus amylolyticus TaxID=1451 RepID=UPI003EBC8F31
MASGDAPLSYQWKKNSTDITGATSSTLTVTNASSGCGQLYGKGGQYGGECNE